MRTLHLFAGSGGGLLADRILGHEPIGAVEIDSYCCAVLRARAADGWFPGLRVHEQDIRMFDPSEYTGRVDCVSGGFPCQDISAAGRGAGIAGEKSGLWVEFERVIRALRPRYSFIENSPILTSRGLDRVLCDLSSLGYDAKWAVVSAADAGASHLRQRIWILAHSKSLIRGLSISAGDEKKGIDPERIGKKVSNANGPGSQRRSSKLEYANQGRQSAQGERQNATGYCSTRGAPKPNVGCVAHGLADEMVCWRGSSQDWWEVEPDVGRVSTGVKNRASRLKALGNGQVPMQAALAWSILMGKN